jgi:uncharacterized membrane protein
MADDPGSSSLFRMMGPFRSRPRLAVSILAGLSAGVAMLAFPEMRASTRLIVGWDVLSVAFLGSMLATMMDHTPTDIRARAALDDEGRGFILTVVLVAAAASVWAVGAELSFAKDAKGLMKLGHVAMAFGTVVASWFMVQMIFTLHYAHEYYGVDEDDGIRDAGGIEFPGHEAPDYWDFLYFAIVIGVASQTADCNIASKGLRRLNTVHCLVAFAFNTVIVALTINLTAGLF